MFMEPTGIILILAPIFAGLWAYLEPRHLDPNAPAKFGLAMLQIAAGFGVLVWGAENFANALRQEVAHLGVDVGSAHMSWIDTPLVQELKVELDSFNKMLAALPGPLSRTTTVAACGSAFVDGIASCLGY